MTRSQTVAADIAALLRARNPLLWIVTREEARAESYLFEAGAAAGFATRTWDVGQGVCEMNGIPAAGVGGPDPGATLDAIRSNATRSGTRTLWIMRDLAPWLQGPVGMTTCRQVRNLARLLPSIQTNNAQAMIVLTPSTDVPPELAGHATVIEWPLPDRDEIASILDAAIESGGSRIEVPTNGTRDAAIDAAVGLSGEEAASCYAKSLVQTKRIDPVMITREKRRVVARERVLEYYDPIPGGLDAVGGLDNLKAWLASRSAAYSPAARAYGLPAPKGALFVGIPGCGKSLTAKAIATAWGCPLLRVDLGALKSKFVGESEGNLRRAFKVIEAMGRCVVWFDEIEKALQGATSGSADGGVSSDALGAILSWMQERQGEAFVIATANDISALPPELLRKGRFDEVWGVDLPNPTERASVITAALRAHGLSGDGKYDSFSPLIEATAGFTGAEIAAIVPDAMYAAFADGERVVSVNDLVAAARTVVPVSKTAAEKIDALRKWMASGRARPASAPEETVDRKPALRAIDL